MTTFKSGSNLLLVAMNFDHFVSFGIVSRDSNKTIL